MGSGEGDLWETETRQRFVFTLLPTWATTSLPSPSALDPNTTSEEPTITCATQDRVVGKVQTGLALGKLEGA